jgi:WD40 repeat protein
VVSASEDYTARVWRTDGTAESVVLSGHEGAVWSASFSADGKRVVTAAGDTTVRVWTVNSPEESIANLWNATPYCLSEEQRIERLGETDEEANINHAACKARVAEYAAQGAYQ